MRLLDGVERWERWERRRSEECGMRRKREERNEDGCVLYDYHDDG